jgi:hypothetical protein
MGSPHGAPPVAVSVAGLVVTATMLRETKGRSLKDLSA